jgi:hypothetical protein
MANQEHLDILAKGVEAWNKWRREHPDVRPDLYGARLEGVKLRGVDMRRADLRLALMPAMDLSGAAFSDADLSGAELAGAIFDLTRLNRTRLNGANVATAWLNRASLRGADLESAYVGRTVFANVDLSETKGLDGVEHVGPSSIGLDTIYRSGGNISEAFLRGCGVPDNFITFAKSLAGSALEFYSCFISYSTKDEDFAHRLYADLQARGVRCWFAPHDMQGGRKIHQQIDDAIRIYDKLLLILSDASMNSNWVKTEIANARAREAQQHRQMLFPITLVPFERIKAWKLFDADTGIDSAREIREYHVPDFSDWKDHDAYSRAFERLVRDLKADPKWKGAAAPEAR